MGEVMVEGRVIGISVGVSIFRSCVYSEREAGCEEKDGREV
jgi:hypothetical protein